MMIALPHRWKTTLMGALASLSLAACGTPTPESRDAENVQVVTVAASPTAAAAPIATPTPASIATPAPIPTALGDMRPRKTFVDPPLPPELRDDGGLRPLPPPPAR